MDKTPKDPDKDEFRPAEKPISLRPLKFEEAVRGLFRVKPDDEKPPRDCK